MTRYILNSNAYHDVIRDNDTGLRVKVYHLDRKPYRPNPAEIHLFGTNGQAMLAFETDGVLPANMLELAPAIAWYAERLPKLELTPFDPRPLVN